MSFQLNVPPSVINKMAQAAEEQPEDGDEPQETGKKREDWRKLKELEEARKAGTAPAMQDEDGRDINPHIPQYIMQAPWYFGANQPTLKHQRAQEENQREFSKDWYKKGVKDVVATKYRKGACENCGAVTHKRKDCLERPRKIGARFTGKNFAPDEYIQTNMEFDYDGKRDRWNGYDTAEHKRIVEEYQKLDEAKRMLKAQRVEDAVQKGEIAPEEAKKVVEEEDEEDEDKYADDVDMPGQKFESKQRITVRNLRIREDTAKYLYNLNVNSAYYDPKTRSMRENPFHATGKEAKDLPYAGDNFVRWTGGAMEMAKQQLFAWEAYEKGSEVNLQADPTKLDMLTREYAKKKEEYKKSTKHGIVDKYGGQEHLEAPPKHLLMAQSEEYVEYSRHGNILKGAEKNKVKSRYEEDVYTNNHTDVWGSFWKEGQWGYKCCHSFIRESYCTGSAGQQAEQTSMLGVAPGPATTVLSSPVSEKVACPPPLAIMPAQKSEEEPEELTERQIRKLKKKEKKKRKKQKEKEKKKKKRRKHSDSESSSSSSESDADMDEATKRERRIVEAIRKEEERLMEVEKMMSIDERKRAYNVTYNLKGPTDEEVEAYQMKRKRDEDPMSQFM